MEVFTSLLVLLCLANFGDFFEMKDEAVKKNMELCEELAKEPYFDIDQVVGRTWRVYYTWFMNMDVKCLDFSFKNATPAIVNRIHHDMYEYLETQPNWSAATLVMSAGVERHEMLLVADQGPAGSFIGVPNVVRASDYPGFKKIPLLKYFLKLLQQGKFLLMTDCNMGYSTVSANKGTPYRSEVLSVARDLHIRIPGHPACILEKREDELTETVFIGHEE